MIAEYDNGAAPANPSREYVYAGGALLAKFDSSGTEYYQQDQSSVRMMTDSSGSVIGERGDFPFGEQWYASNTTTKWAFTSYERDAESGNNYATGREYVNRLGRFSALDAAAPSISDPQSMSRYSYVENDPINNIDPTGEDFYLDGVDESSSALIINGPPDFGQFTTLGLLDMQVDIWNEEEDLYGGYAPGGDGQNDPSRPNVIMAETQLATFQMDFTNFAAIDFLATNRGGGGFSFSDVKTLLRKIILNPKCAKLLGGREKANEAINHLTGIQNVDAPSYSGSAKPKAIIDSGTAYAVTPVPVSGNFRNGRWVGRNFVSYIGSAVANWDLSQQATVEMHELIHVTTPGDFYSQGLVDLMNSYGQLTNVFEIAHDCGTQLPPTY